MRNRRASALGVAVAAAIVASAVAAPRASAVLMNLQNGKTVSYQPLRTAAAQFSRFDKAFNNMDYNGGPVMPSNTAYMVLWSPKGLSAYPARYVSGLKRYFHDLARDSGGHQNVNSVASQYNDVTGAFSRYDVTFGGALVDTNPYPKSECPVHKPVKACLTDGQLQHQLEKFVASKHLPRDLSHEYFLMTPPRTEGCFTSNPHSKTPYGGCSAGEIPRRLAAYCAYHANTVVSPMLFYADDPYVTGNPGCEDGNHPNGPADGAIEGGLSHEFNESVTDPLPNDAWTNGTGNDHGEEVGDQCDVKMGPPLGTAPNGARYNQIINGHFYWYQEEWSNAGHACMQRRPLTIANPTATYTVTAGGGLAMSFNATGSTAPGGVADFSWQFNDAFGANTVERTSPTITHMFPEAGAYSTGLAVFAHNGLSIGTGGIVRTGHSGFAHGFKFSPASPSAGHTVDFSALTEISRKPVKVYLWEFGDGTTGSGATPKHRYATPGSYKVIAVLFSGVGSAFPGAGAGPVVTRTIAVH